MSDGFSSVSNSQVSQPDSGAETYSLPDDDVQQAMQMAAMQMAADEPVTVSIDENDSDHTFSLSREDFPLVETPQPNTERQLGTQNFESNMLLRIEIEGLSRPILVSPHEELIIGRRDPTTGDAPVIDLTPFAAYRMGVSRHHAALGLHESRLDVRDLGSCNGTFLNGMRLNAHHPYQVRHGDEIRCGQMVMRLFFQEQRTP